MNIEDALLVACIDLRATSVWIALQRELVCIVRGRGLSREECEDLVGDILLHLWEHPHLFRQPEGGARRFLYVQRRHGLRRWYRSRNNPRRRKSDRQEMYEREAREAFQPATALHTVSRGKLRTAWVRATESVLRSRTRHPSNVQQALADLDQMIWQDLDMDDLLSAQGFHSTHPARETERERLYKSHQRARARLAPLLQRVAALAR